MTGERGKDEPYISPLYTADYDGPKIDTAKEYLEFQNATSWYVHAGEKNAPELSYLIHGLNGESGEFTDEFKKITRKCGYTNPTEFARLMHHPEHRATLHKEAGDVVWYLNKILDFLGLDLEMVMVMNTYKLYRRLKDRPEFEELEWPFTNPDYSWKAIHEQFKDIGD